MDVLDDLAGGEVGQSEGVVASLHHLEVPRCSAWLPGAVDLLILGRPVVHRADTKVKHELAGNRGVLVLDGVAAARKHRGTRPQLLPPLASLPSGMGHAAGRKPVTLPEDATVDDILEAYLEAWRLGLREQRAAG